MNLALIAGTIAIWLAAVLGMFAAAALLALSMALFPPGGRDPPPGAQ